MIKEVELLLTLTQYSALSGWMSSTHGWTAPCKMISLIFIFPHMLAPNPQSLREHSEYHATPLRIEKIGGDNTTQVRQTLAMLNSRRWKERWVYVLSAFRSSDKNWFNTTSHLIEAGEACKRWDQNATLQLLSEVEDFYLSILQSGLPENTTIQWYCQWLFDLYRQQIYEYFKNKNLFYFPHWGSWHKNFLPEKSNDYTIPGFSFLGIGEVVTAKLYAQLLGESVVETGADTLTPRSIAEIRNEIGEQVEALLDRSRLVLVPGFLGRLREWILNTWERGYSDPALWAVTRAMIERSLSGVLKMQKDIPVSSADHRIVGRDKVKPLRNPSLALILEMVSDSGADGGFINEHLLDPALFVDNGSLHLYSPRDEVGTTITLEWWEMPDGVLAVQKKSVIAFTITSYRFREAWYGAKITEFFRDKKLSYADSPSSETTMTYTINEKRLSWIDIEELRSELEIYLRKFEWDLEPFPTVQTKPLTTIHLIGERLNFPRILGSIAETLDGLDINKEFVSQPTSGKAVIIGIEKDRWDEAVRVLHKKLIEER
jgi:aspartokinase